MEEIENPGSVRCAADPFAYRALADLEDEPEEAALLKVCDGVGCGVRC